MTNKRDSKKAVIAAAFGSTNTEGRNMALDGLIGELEKRHPDIAIRRAYISDVIRQRVLANEGIALKSPEEVLKALSLEGVTEVAIVTTELIPGAVYQSMENLVESYRDGFSQLTLAKSILWDINEDGADDIDKLLEAVGISSQADENASDVKGLAGADSAGKGSALILMCHGTKHPSQKYYSMINNRLKDGFPGVYMYCLEASPSIEALSQVLKADGVKSVRLRPLMYTLGKHVLRDMERDGEFLRNKGFKVIEFSRECLSENQSVISMLGDRADEALLQLDEFKQVKGGGTDR